MTAGRATDPAPSQCLYCAGVERHTTICPEALRVWPAHGNEVCSLCRGDVGEHYTHLEHTPGAEIIGEPDAIVCLGCAATKAILEDAS